MKCMASFVCGGVWGASLGEGVGGVSLDEGVGGVSLGEGVGGVSLGACSVGGGCVSNLWSLIM